MNRKYLDNFLNKAGPASDEAWVPGEETIQNLESSKVLSVSKCMSKSMLQANAHRVMYAIPKSMLAESKTRSQRSRRSGM